MATTAHASSGREDFEMLLAQFVENKIRERAYQLYVQRGKVSGHALDDWLKSESEVWGQPKKGTHLRAEGNRKTHA